MTSKRGFLDSASASLTSLGWASGHAVFLIFALAHFVTSISAFYKISLLALLVSLISEVYRSSPQVTVDSVMASEKSPYIFLSILLYILTPSSLVLAPMAVTSLYAFLGHAKSNTDISQNFYWRQYVAQPADRLTALQPTILESMAWLEMAILPILVLSIFSTGIMLPIMYTSFLRWQYMVTPRMRLAWAKCDTLGQGLVEKQACPKQVRHMYGRLRSVLKNWVRMPADNSATTSASNMKASRPVSGAGGSGAHPVRKF